MKGFSLLEVMISSAVLIVGLTGTVQAISTASSQMEHARHVTQALHAAETQMEVLLSHPANIATASLTPGASITGPTYNSVGEPTTNTSDPFESYYETSWQVVGNEPIVGMKKITLQASWDERGVRRNITLVTERR